MTRARRKSILSTQTEPSIQSASVIALGKTLVEELKMEPGADTLGRWMAHYIAELIKAVEETEEQELREKAQQKCFETIIKLWEHRASICGRICPLSNVAEVLEAIRNLFGQKTELSFLLARDAERIGGPWMRFAQSIENTGSRMCKIAVLMAIAEASFDKEKRWLQNHGDMLSKEEVEIINALDGWLSEKTNWLSNPKERPTSVGEMEPEQRNERVVKEITALLGELNSSFAFLQERANDNPKA